MGRAESGARPSPLSTASSDTLGRVRDALNQAGYEEASVHDLLHVAVLPSFRRRREARADSLARTKGRSPLETLVRLFLLREPAAVEAVQGIQPTRLEDWIETGLLVRDPAGVLATVELTPCEGLAVASDWAGLPPRDPLEVMSVTASSRALAQTMVRRSVETCLDLGTGSGVLALLAARHCGQAVATDKNPRAVAFARWNARLNGVKNVSFLEGDLFSPVEGETFDLVLCNPPFVLAPSVDFLHSHSGLPADTFLREIIRQAPGYLAEGGVCQIIGNWAEVSGEDWRERLASWFSGTGCDAWVLYSHSEEAEAYARERIAESGEDVEPFAAKLDRWIAAYRRERIEAVGFGVITMRRRGNGASHVFECRSLAEVLAEAPDPAGPEALRRYLERVTGEPPKGSRS